jgi:DNA translocase FtsK/SpoIIIE-like protein
VSYTAVVDRGPASAMPAAKDDIQIPGKIPYIVIIIDELVDLVQTVSADVESAIARVMQMGRAAASI